MPPGATVSKASVSLPCSTSTTVYLPVKPCDGALPALLLSNSASTADAVRLLPACRCMLLPGTLPAKAVPQPAFAKQCSHPITVLSCPAASNASPILEERKHSSHLERCLHAEVYDATKGTVKDASASASATFTQYKSWIEWETKRSSNSLSKTLQVSPGCSLLLVRW